jgi:hypothetical protein
MRPFEENPECSKCGCTEIALTYYPEETDIEEHLHCYCTTCRYQWDMCCKEPDSVELDIREQLDNTGAMR